MASTRKHELDEPVSESALVPRTRKFLEANLKPGAQVSLGYSGGLDSTVLLHILLRLRAEMGLSFTALHVDHGLSPHAADWAEHCRATCDRHGVSLAVESVRVVPSGQGIEAAAREARYEAFGRHGADYILLAHHLDDQVETFFLRALRGAGPRGLAGMRGVTRHHGLTLMRPLLDVSRDELERYAKRHGLSFIQDESNRDQIVPRNFLRQSWLPALEQRLPGYRRIIAADMAHLDECAGLLDDLARQDAAGLAEFARPDLDRMRLLGEARGKNLLRYWLRDQADLLPSAAQLGVLWRQMTEARPDAEPVWQCGGREVRRFRGQLYILLPTELAEVAPVTLDWNGLEQLDWPLGGRLILKQQLGAGVSCARMAEAKVRFVTREGGERLRPHCRRPERPVKKWLQEAGMTPWQRSRLPILMLSGQLAWVPDVGVDCRFQAQTGEPGWLISWQSRP